MSLENALKENTAAVIALTEMIATGKKEHADKTANKAAIEKAETTVKKDAKPKGEKASVKEEKAVEEDESEISYDEVKDATLKLNKLKGRETVMKNLHKYNKDALSARDLKPAQYADYLEDVKKLFPSEGDDDIA